MEPIGNFSSNEASSTSGKVQRWLQMAERVACVVDKLGHSVDEGIRETVIVLNLLGITTLASCEGHLDHGDAAPWVDIGSPQAKPFEEEARQKLRAARQAREQGISQEQYAVLQEKAEPARRAAQEMHWQVIARLIPYLQRFYEQHPMVFERHLIVQKPFWLGEGRLQSYFWLFSDLEPAGLKPQRLTEYQAEMQAFTEFLKEVFFQDT